MTVVYVLSTEGVTRDIVWSTTEAQTLAFLGARKRHLLVYASGKAFHSTDTYDERGI